MFDSNIKVKDMIELIKDEADIAISIPDGSYILWLNALEQLLYSEIIKEQGAITLDSVSKSVSMDELDVPDGEDAVRFEDIHAVYADETQLIKSTAASGTIFADTYYKLQNKLCFNLKLHSAKLKIVYIVRPALKTSDNIKSAHVMLPVEFIDLAKAKLRGEAYKLANEDSLAAKWLNDYNVLLETFKVWLSEKSPKFGM